MRPASAADMGVKAAPTPVPVPQYSWTGFYIGAQGGYAWGYPEFDTSTPFFEHAWSANGGYGGGMIGANYEFGATHVVVGIEGEYNGGDLTGKNFDGTNSHSATLNSFGSVGARLGFDLNDPVWRNRSLLYAVGGVAFGDPQQTFTKGLAGPSVTFSSGNSVGWDLGAGVEYAFLDNWTARIEWRMYDFDVASFGPNVIIDAGTGAITTYGSKLTVNVARFGVAYKF